MMAHTLIASKDLFVDSSFYYIQTLQQCSLFESPHVFKVPVLPPWRIRKKIKKSTNELFIKPADLPKLVHNFVLRASQVNCKNKEKKSNNANMYYYKNKKSDKMTEAVEVIKQIGHLKKGNHVTKNNTIVQNYLSQIEKVLPNQTKEVIQLKSLTLYPCKKEDAFKFTMIQTYKLLVCLMKHINCKTISDLKNRKIADCQWKKIAKKLKTPVFHTKKYWYHKLHMQLFCPKPIRMTDIISKFIEHLYITKDHPVHWGPILSTNFDGFTLEFLSKIYDFLLSFAKRSFSFQADNSTYIHFLYKHHLDVVKKTKSNWILPRLDHILRRKDPVFNKKCKILNDTFDVIRHYGDHNDLIVKPLSFLTC